MNVDYTSLKKSPVYEADKVSLSDTGKKYSIKIWLIILAICLPPAWPFLAYYTYTYYRNNKEKTNQRIYIIEQFAKENNYKFHAYHTGFASAFKASDKINIHLPYRTQLGQPWYLLTGKLRNLDFYYTMVSTQNGREDSGGLGISYCMFSVALPITMPTLFVNSKRNNLVGLENNNLQINEVQSYQLEGDFQNYFTVHAEKNDQINTLKILTPEVMDVLKRNDSFDVWIEGNRMSLITSAHMVRFFSEVEDFFKLSDMLLQEIDAIARALNKTEQI